MVCLKSIEESYMSLKRWYRREGPKEAQLQGVHSYQSTGAVDQSTGGLTESAVHVWHKEQSTDNTVSRLKIQQRVEQSTDMPVSRLMCVPKSLSVDWVLRPVD